MGIHSSKLTLQLTGGKQGPRLRGIRRPQRLIAKLTYYHRVMFLIMDVRVL